MITIQIDDITVTVSQRDEDQHIYSVGENVARALLAMAATGQIVSGMDALIDAILWAEESMGSPPSFVHWNTDRHPDRARVAEAAYEKMIDAIRSYDTTINLLREEN
jgi:ATP:corrinoid adenosyltransferase